MTTIRSFLIALFLATAMVFAGAASADFQRDSDRDDSPGRLDIKSVAQGHVRGLLLHRIGMYEEWNSRLLRGRKNWIGIWISTNDPSPNEGFERYLRIDYRKGHGLLARMYSEWQQRLVSAGRVRVMRPDDRVVKVKFSRRLLGDDVDRYRWFVETSFQGADSCGPDVISEDALSYGNCADTSATRRH